jgi:hypothetical protein
MKAVEDPYLKSPAPDSWKRVYKLRYLKVRQTIEAVSKELLEHPEAKVTKRKALFISYDSVF